MDTFEAIEKRRSIKHFDPRHQMTEEEIKKLLSLAMLSPTSFNVQNWRFVLVREKRLREEIKEASWNQPQVTSASLLIVLCANNNFWKQADRYYVKAPENVQNLLSKIIRDLYQDAPQLQRDEAMRSGGIAAQTLMLAAKAMGYESSAMVGFDPKRVAQIINLPDDHVIVMLVCIGRALKEARPRTGQLPMEEVVVVDRFS